VAYSVLQSAAGTAVALSASATYATANLTAGTKLTAAVANSGNANPASTVKDGAGNSFTKIAAQALNNSSASGELSLWAIDTPAGDAGTKPVITVTLSGTGTPDVAILIQEVSGLATGNTLAAMIDGTAGTGSGTGGASTGSPSYTSTAAGEYLAAVYGDNGGPETWTKPSGTTSDASSINSSSLDDLAIAWKDSANGAEAGSWALTGTGTPWATILVAFRLATAATAVTWVPQRYVQAVPPSAAVWAQRDRRDANTVATAANPLVSPLDSAWQADAAYWHLYGDDALRDRRQYFQQRPYVSQPGLLASPGNLDPTLAAWADTERRYLTAAYWDRREIPQQKDMRDANQLGVPGAVIDPTTSAAQDRAVRYGLAATHADRRLVPQQRAYPDRQPDGTYTAGPPYVTGAWWSDDVLTFQVQRAPVSDPSMLIPQADVGVGSGTTEAWWGVAPEPYQAGQRAYISDPSFYPVPNPLMSPLDSAWQAGGGYQNRYAAWLRPGSWPLQRAYISDPGMLIPPAVTDPALSAWLPLRLAYGTAATSYDRREIPQQRTYISDPSFYPSGAVTDPLTVAWGAGGGYWHRYSTAADTVPRWCVPQQRAYPDRQADGSYTAGPSYITAAWWSADDQGWNLQRQLVSDPSVLAAALLEGVLLGSAGTFQRYGVAATHADRRQMPQQPPRLALQAPLVPLDPVQSAWAALWLAYNLAATHQDRRLYPQQRPCFPLPAPPPPFTIGQLTAGSAPAAALTAVTSAAAATASLTAATTPTGGPS
jgi:hypothetical protein